MGSALIVQAGEPAAEANKGDSDAAASSLDAFFELGMPDAKGAKWVHATVFGNGVFYGQGIGGREVSIPKVAGNAWLVRDDPDGTVELIFEQRELVRARRADRIRPPKPGSKGEEGLPMAQIQPADLAHDIQALEAAFNPSAKKVDEPDDPDAPINGGLPSLPQNKLAQAGWALLFLAQLQHLGHEADALRILPAVMAAAPSPERLLDYTLSTLADACMTQLAGDWTRSGDAAAYADGIEKVAARFARGWKRRTAALALAQRVRAQQAAETPESAQPKSDEPARKLADLLLAASPA